MVGQYPCNSFSEVLSGLFRYPNVAAVRVDDLELVQRVGICWPDPGMEYDMPEDAVDNLGFEREPGTLPLLLHGQVRVGVFLPAPARRSHQPTVPSATAGK